MKKFNKIAFIVFILFVATFSYWFNEGESDVEKPWHMQPYTHEDSLSVFLKNNFKIVEENRAFEYKEIPVLVDSLKTTVFILVDAWGVPVNDSLMQEDFSFFSKVSAKTFAIHKRLANRTMHAERVELRFGDSAGVYLFGGDSTEYNRKSYIPELGFKETLFCQNCRDSVMLANIDSILSLDSLKYIALTTQSSRDGNRENLHSSLKLISNLVCKHPEARFIIQGTHRPTLGSPETRKMYYPHWVPLIYLNY